MNIESDPKGVFNAWEAGAITPAEAMRTLGPALRALDGEISALNTRRDALRDQISQVVAQLGGRAVLPGIGRFEITSASRSVTYDRRQLDALHEELLVTDPVLAARLEDARRESMRAGGLRFSAERELP